MRIGALVPLTRPGGVVALAGEYHTSALLLLVGDPEPIVKAVRGDDRIAEAWPPVSVEGTRGRIEFTRAPGISVWQWAEAPVRVVERVASGRLRSLHVDA